MGVIHQSVRLECFSDEFLNDDSWSETVAWMRDFDESAAERYRYLQELSRRLMAKATADRSDG